jgi:hypothetical protein
LSSWYYFMRLSRVWTSPIRKDWIALRWILIYNRCAYAQSLVLWPLSPAPKKSYHFDTTFLSIAKAMAYHHALACISSPQAYLISRRL